MSAALTTCAPSPRRLRRLHRLRARLLERWRDLGFPEAIAQFLDEYLQTAGLHGGRLPEHYRRAHRFIRYASCSDARAEELAAAWRTVERRGAIPACDTTAELRVFISLPDRLALQPFAGAYRGRSTSPETIEQERRELVDWRRHVAAVRALLGPPYDQFQALLADAGANERTLSAMGLFRQQHEQQLRAGLKALDQLLQTIDPAAKLLTKQPNAKDAPHAVAIARVASMAHFFHSPPPWAALATLLQINCPGVKVSADALRKRHRLTREEAD